jgi:hypothetical protein
MKPIRSDTPRSRVLFAIWASRSMMPSKLRKRSTSEAVDRARQLSLDPSDELGRHENGPVPRARQKSFQIRTCTLSSPTGHALPTSANVAWPDGALTYGKSRRQFPPTVGLL